MAKATGIIDRPSYNRMPPEVLERLEGPVIKGHVGRAVYRGKYPEPEVVTSALWPGQPDAYMELAVVLDRTNLPRPKTSKDDALKEEWFRTNTGLHVPESVLTEEERRDAVPVTRHLDEVTLALHVARIGELVTTSLAGDPIWQEEGVGWQRVVRDSTILPDLLGVSVELGRTTSWHDTSI